MGYAGVKDPRERADLIAWLREATRPGARCSVSR
jgi:cytochrome c